jgi:hypothetical protein
VITAGQVDRHLELGEEALGLGKVLPLEKILELTLIDEVSRKHHELGIDDVDVLDYLPEVHDLGRVGGGSAVRIEVVGRHMGVGDLDEVVIGLEARDHPDGVAGGVGDAATRRDHQVVELVDGDRRYLDPHLPPQG